MRAFWIITEPVAGHYALPDSLTKFPSAGTAISGVGRNS